MKIMEFSEFIEQAKKVEPEKKLVFLSFINPDTGMPSPAISSPEEFDHVVRVANNLYLAWEENYSAGWCFIGEYQ